MNVLGLPRTVRAVVFALEEAWRMFLGVFDTADYDSDAVMGASRKEQGFSEGHAAEPHIVNSKHPICDPGFGIL